MFIHRLLFIFQWRLLPTRVLSLQETLSEDERKHREALEDLHMAVDEDSRSESSSADEGKEKTKLLLERLKALEVRNETIFTHLKKNKCSASFVGTDFE